MPKTFTKYLALSACVLMTVMVLLSGISMPEAALTVAANVDAVPAFVGGAAIVVVVALITVFVVIVAATVSDDGAIAACVAGVVLFVGIASGAFASVVGTLVFAAAVGFAGAATLLTYAVIKGRYARKGEKQEAAPVSERPSSCGLVILR